MIIKFKYPKLSLFVFITTVVAMFFVSFDLVQVQNILNHLGYLAAFLAGLLYTVSFTGSLAAVVFYMLGDGGSVNILLASIIGGIGAGLGDLVILKIIKASFIDEVEVLLQGRVSQILQSKTNLFLKKIFNTILGILIIASPLPDEVGLTFLSGLKRLNTQQLFVICSIINSAGIYFILSWGNA